MEKYYTPTLEEFHVGFEFEYNKGKDNWVKHISGNGDFIDGMIDVGVGEVDDALYNPFHMGIGKRDFRVKHLDREDIESFYPIDEWFKSKGQYGGTYRIKFTVSHHITIESKDFVRDGSGNFKVTTKVNRLIIKNKSELRKLLKQLGI